MKQRFGSSKIYTGLTNPLAKLTKIEGEDPN
jgi:hypothetical protein